MKTKLAILLILMATCARAADKQYPTWEGWELMGAAGVFSYDVSGTQKILVASTPDKAAALRKPAEYVLTPDLEFSWQWQVAEIPSTFAEDTKEKHHYFAVSVIFDNGKNLSYVWSATLPQEFSYKCPLDDWKDKETHVVVETGTARFNQVLSYKRNLMADYARFIGGPKPAKASKLFIVALGGGERPLNVRVMNLGIGSAKNPSTNLL